MSNRKQHNQEAGYVAERMNPHVKGCKVVIYVAEKQGMDVGEKYAVVCDSHSTLVGDSSLKAARLSMKAPENFCDGCRKIVDEQMEATIDQLQTQYWYLTSEMSWADKQGHIADQEKLRKERLHIVDELLAAGHTGSIDSKLDDFYRW